ncbi:MAG TPA: immunoglobulin domain-containing protein, partial [candidate division Zixibacteria bacterium]|nr:immunoglobulin domain-containing protein [candidate division Zixibacteria bacterium]
IAYPHNGSPTACAITGGAFYTGTKYPSQFANAFFYADFCAQWIYYLTAPGYNTQTAFATALGRSAVDLQVWDGELYYLTRNSGGAVFRIAYTLNEPPAITQHPANQTVAINQTAQFSVAATGTPPLSYEWQRNGAPISGAPNSPSYTTPPATAGDDGARFRALVSNSFGNATSNEGILTVQANTPPTPTINTPIEGTSFTWAQTINFSGSASDAQDPSLPPSAFFWKVDLHHDSHAHPHVLGISGVTSGTFVTNFAESSANVFYRIYLTVTDSGGAQSTTFRDIVPQTATVTLRTRPGGLGLTLDGIPVAHGHTFTAIVGQLREIGAPSPQAKGKF